ncbi:hypothetical protein D3C81_700110 [compost metagenome]
MHGQRLAGPLGDQAVIRVGQGTVVMEAQHAAPLQDGGQARMVGDGEAASQRIAAQACHRHRAQVFAIELEQGHGFAAEVRAQAAHQALQAHGHGQVGDQVGEQQQVDGGGGHHDHAGYNGPCFSGVIMTMRFSNH